MSKQQIPYFALDLAYANAVRHAQHATPNSSSCSPKVIADASSAVIGMLQSGHLLEERHFDAQEEHTNLSENPFHVVQELQGRGHAWHGNKLSQQRAHSEVDGKTRLLLQRQNNNRVPFCAGKRAYGYIQFFLAVKPGATEDWDGFFCLSSFALATMNDRNEFKCKIGSLNCIL